MKSRIPEDQRSPALRSYYKNHERNMVRCRVRRKKAYASNPAKYRKSKYAWRDSNIDKVRQSTRNSYQINREKKLAYNKRYYSRNKTHLLAQSALYRLTHKTSLQRLNHTYYINNFVRIQAYNKKYKIENRNIINRINQRRNARKKRLPCTFTKEQCQFMLQYWGYACAICGNQEGFQWTLALEHWIALSSPECPGTVATNMLPLCHGLNGCNNSKFNKDGPLWLRERYGVRKANKILKAVTAYFALVATMGTPLFTDTCHSA